MKTIKTLAVVLAVLFGLHIVALTTQSSIIEVVSWLLSD